MRIAVVVGTFGSGRGSGGQAELLVDGLRARGHRVAVWCREDDRGEVHVHRLPRARRALPSFMATFPREEFDLVIALERVPHADIARAGGGVHGSWTASAPGPLRRLGLRSRDRREARLDRLTARTARRVVANSWRTAAEIVAWHGVPPERVQVIRNGVDLVRFAPRRPSVPGARRVALFLGESAERKGLDVALAAFRAAAGPRDRLWVAGSELAGAPSDVEVLGHVDPAQVLPQVDALILPTRYDPSSNAVLEALACGVPAVTSARDGSSELLDDPRLVVPRPRDVQGFGAALRYAWEIGDPARWRAIATRWPASRMVDETEQLTRRLVDGQETSRGPNPGPS